VDRGAAMLAAPETRFQRMVSKGTDEGLWKSEREHFMSIDLGAAR
jgi:hypothetical protein